MGIGFSKEATEKNETVLQSFEIEKDHQGCDVIRVDDGSVRKLFDRFQLRLRIVAADTGPDEDGGVATYYTIQAEPYVVAVLGAGASVAAHAALLTASIRGMVPGGVAKWITREFELAPPAVTRHRFRELHKLYGDLALRYPEGQLGGFPARTLFRHVDDEFVAHRAEELQRFLDAVALGWPDPVFPRVTFYVWEADASVRDFFGFGQFPAEVVKDGRRFNLRVDPAIPVHPAYLNSDDLRRRCPYGYLLDQSWRADRNSFAGFSPVPSLSQEEEEDIPTLDLSAPDEPDETDQISLISNEFLPLKE